MPADNLRSEHHSIETEILDGDLHPDDLVFALRHLNFGQNGLAAVRLDRDVRNYLIAAVRQRTHGPS